MSSPAPLGSTDSSSSQGDHPGARRWLEEADRIAAGLSVARQAGIATIVAFVAVSDGDQVLALERSQRAIAMCQEIGAVQELAKAFTVIAWAQFLATDLDAATAANREAVTLVEGTSYLTVAAYAHLGPSYCAAPGGDVPAQREHVLAALAAIEGGGVLHDVDLLGVCAVLAIAERRIFTAGRLYGASLDRTARGNPHPGAMEEMLHQVLWLPIESTLGPGDLIVLEQVVAEGARMAMDDLVAEALSGHDVRADSLLSPRELTVADLVAEGMTNREIIARLATWSTARYLTRVEVAQVLAAEAGLALRPRPRGRGPLEHLERYGESKLQRERDGLAEAVRRVHREHQGEGLRIAVVHWVEALPTVARSLGAIGYAPTEVDWILVFRWLPGEAPTGDPPGWYGQRLIDQAGGA